MTSKPTLREHPGATVASMTMSKDCHDLMQKLDRFRPRFGGSTSYRSAVDPRMTMEKDCEAAN